MYTPTNVTVHVTPQNRVAQRLEIAARVIMLVYTAFTAWQVAKAICPPLAVREQIVMERVRRKLASNRPRQVTRQQADEFVAEVTRFVREHEGK